MNRRIALASTIFPVTPLIGLPLAGCAAPRAGAPVRTRWVIATSEGFDALAFLGPLSGKPFYADYYAREIAEFKPRLSPTVHEAIGSLFAQADADGYLLWPRLALIFSGGPHGSIGDLLASLAAAESVLRRPFEASVYWDARKWQQFLDGRERLALVLSALRQADFANYRSAHLEPHAADRRSRLRALLEPLDIVAEQERLLGRALEPQIEIHLLWFCRPHGVKVQGQRFLTHVLSSDQTLVQTAAHENLHPPIDMKGATARDCIAMLEKDPLLGRILREKSKDSGYNSIEGLFDEGLVQALDQIIQERLGFGRPAARRWLQADEGIHVLAAGLYGLLKADGYDRSGGNIEAWLALALRKGRLAPPILHAAAAQVLGRPIDQFWSRNPSR
jgi:hypothetical protein